MITLTMITLSGFDCTKNCLSNRNLMLDLILFSFRKIWSVPWSLWRTLTLQWQKKVIRYFRQHFCLLLILLKTNSFNPSKGQLYQHFKGRICASRFKLLFEVNGVKVGYNYKVCATVDRSKILLVKVHGTIYTKSSAPEGLMNLTQKLFFYIQCSYQTNSVAKFLIRFSKDIQDETNF